MKFPNTILITKEKDGDDEYLNIHDNPQEVGRLMDNIIKSVDVATYKLVEVRKLNFLPNWAKRKSKN